MTGLSRSSIIAVAWVAGAGLWTSPVLAEPAPRPAIATVSSILPTRTAVLFALKMQLPQGQGLARLLLDLGVDRDDAAAAARLGAGHLGANKGGCDAKVEISRTIDGTGYRLERVALTTTAGQTIIERRDGMLAITAESGPQVAARLA